jgi:hypothetical protein
MSCPIESTATEHRCLACGARWDFDDDMPACPSGPVTSMADLDTRPPVGPAARPAPAPVPWTPPTSRDGVAARLRRALTMQTGRGQDPLAVSITPNLARDILAHLERTP